MMPSSWTTTVSDLFSLNIFTTKASELYSFSSQSRLHLGGNSLDSFQDAVEIPFLTPQSSPIPPCSFNHIPSFPRSSSYAEASPPRFFSSASSVLLPSARSSPNLLPLPSQRSVIGQARHGDPSLMDSSVSFAHMMKKTVDGGSPASFLTCSSGWDPGVICEAVALPSLLNTPPSWDALQKVATIQIASHSGDRSASRSGDGLGLEILPSSLPSFGSHSRIAMATTVYLSSSLLDVSPVCFDKSAGTKSVLVDDWKDTSIYDRDESYSLPFCQESGLRNHSVCSDRSPIQTVGSRSPCASSPISDISSITSSFYEDPFHWDSVLSTLPRFMDPIDVIGMPSSQSSLVLPRSLSSYSQQVQKQERCSSASSEPSLTTASSSASGIIPTIVILDPDSVSIPIQASISSIVGLYEGLGSSGEYPPVMNRTKPASLIQEKVENVDSSDDHRRSSDTDGDDSYDEEDFEIIAVPALRTRLETIFEEDETGNSLRDNKECTTATPTDGCCITGVTVFPSGGYSANILTSSVTSSSCTSSSSDGLNFNTGLFIDSGSDSFYSQASRKRYFPPSHSATSTVRLVYRESDSSIAERSECSFDNKISPVKNSAKQYAEDDEWVFQVEDGAILEIPIIVQSSSSSTTRSKIADKLASFPNVPTSTFFSPLTSPFSSMSTARRHELNITSGHGGGAERTVSGLGISLDGLAPSSSPLLSPTYVYGGGSFNMGSSSMLGLGISSLGTHNPSKSPSSPSVCFEFQDLNLELDFPGATGHSTYTPGLHSASNEVEAMRRRELHVRFESADFKPKIANFGKRRPSKHRSIMLAKIRKSCLRGRRATCKFPQDNGVVGACGDLGNRTEFHSSNPSSSIVERENRRRRGWSMVIFSKRRRFLDGLKKLKGCWALGEDDDDYWEDAMGEGHFDIVGDWMRDENDARRNERERYMFYQRWKNVWP